MIGIIVQLALSWLLIWLFEKKDLAVLGLKPTKQRLTDFLLFLLLAAFCATSGFLMRMYYEERWTINPDFTFKLLVDGLWWNIKSVMFEELIFRGVIFYILIKRIGVGKAIIVSSIAFGIYHWFTYEAFGNPKQMVFVFFITGIIGLVYAYGYAKTFSLYIPAAIHLGWNCTGNFIFSEGQIGKGILVKVEPVPVVQVSYLEFFVVSYLPMGLLIGSCFWLIKKKKQF